MNGGQQPDGRYSRFFRLGATEVDLNNRLRLSSLLGFFQETAGDQCEEFGSGWSTLWEKHGLCYVVVRLEVRMDRYPGTGETVRVDTWPDSKLRMIFDRYGLIFDGNGAQIGAIASQWALLDVKERHFVRPDPAVIVMPDTASLSAPFKISVLKEHEEPDSDAVYSQLSRPPRFSDFDYNGHVNNARYAEWITDALREISGGSVCSSKSTVSRLSIGFRAEIPASSEGVPVTLTGWFSRSSGRFSMKGTGRSANQKDVERAEKNVVYFEAEGNVSHK